MTHRVGAKGQVVIPKEIRDAMGLLPGDEVTFSFDGLAVEVRRARPSGDIRERFRGVDLVGMLEANRREERRR